MISALGLNTTNVSEGRFNRSSLVIMYWSTKSSFVAKDLLMAHPGFDAVSLFPKKHVVVCKLFPEYSLVTDLVHALQTNGHEDGYEHEINVAAARAVSCLHKYTQF